MVDTLLLGRLNDIVELIRKLDLLVFEIIDYDLLFQVLTLQLIDLLEGIIHVVSEYKVVIDYTGDFLPWDIPI